MSGWGIRGGAVLSDEAEGRAEREKLEGRGGKRVKGFWCGRNRSLENPTSTALPGSANPLITRDCRTRDHCSVVIAIDEDDSVRKEAGREESWFKTRGLLADGRRSLAEVGLLSTTDTGGLVPAAEDAGSEMSERERRERTEREKERRVEAGERGTGGEELPQFLPAPAFVELRRRSRGRARFVLFFPFTVSSVLTFNTRHLNTERREKHFQHLSFFLLLLRCSLSLVPILPFWDRPGRRAEGGGELAMSRLDGKPGQCVHRQYLHRSHAIDGKTNKN